MPKKAYILSALLLCFHISFSQTTFLPIGSEDMHVLDRLETLSGKLGDTIFNGDKPESRKNAVYFIESILAEQKNDSAKVADTIAEKPIKLSQTDQYNITQMISENGEWTPKGTGAIYSKHPWLDAFYVKQYDFGYVKSDDDFFLVVNPVFSGIGMYQHNSPTPAGIPDKLFTNSQGAELRGWIAKKLGFYTSVTDNQEQYPYFIYRTVSDPSRQEVPGADYFLLPGQATASAGRYDYMQASGYINFDAVKNHVNVSFGSGKHFIGDGISSLFLTDYSSNMPFLQLQARIWHINYECLYLELTPQYDKNLGDGLLAHKFSTIHFLNWNVTRWLDLGFFESEVFDRPDVYEISYLNPIIFSTAVNRFNGEGDKSILGMSGKAIVARHFQFYGQLMLDEFRAKDLFSNDGWYGNKWGLQGGAKYFDAFGIKNLDLQGELMAVRPYSYSAKDTFDNYTNYNQPLADPLGSGFIKAVGLAKYQPVKDVYLSLKGTYYIQGMDTGNTNLGNNIFDPYSTAPQAFGVKMINGPKSHCEMMSLNISYQLKRNLFIDAGGTYRRYTNSVATAANPEYSTTGYIDGSLNTSYFYVGVRINTVRRDYDFY